MKINNFLREGFKYFIQGNISFSYFYIIENTRINKKIKHKLYPNILQYENIKFYLKYPSLDLNIWQLWYGLAEYEHNKSYLPKNGWNVIDVGAYNGLYSLLVAKSVGEDGKVFAFEPNPFTFYWLNANIKLNKMKNIKAYSFALGDFDGYIDFVCIFENNPGTSKIKQLLTKEYENENAYVIKVPIFRLDTLIENRYLDISFIDLMKIDVEGAELLILKGSRKSLEKGIVDKLIIEIHKNIINKEDIIDFLKEVGIKLEKEIETNDKRIIGYFKLIK